MLHSFHLAELPASASAVALIRPPRRSRVPGLQHAESLALMQFGAPILSVKRLRLRQFGLFAQWDDEAALDRFLVTHPLGQRLSAGWHVRMTFLRRYGSIAALGDLPARAGDWSQDEPVVAVTVARMKPLEIPRFLRWGKPVEILVRDHPGAIFATGAQRPPHTISTFSIWHSVEQMTDMVHGPGHREPSPKSREPSRNSREPSRKSIEPSLVDPSVHKVAMAEQRRRDFHHESAFMRFRPVSEHGTWQGRRFLPHL